MLEDRTKITQKTVDYLFNKIYKTSLNKQILDKRVNIMNLGEHIILKFDSNN